MTQLEHDLRIRLCDSSLKLTMTRKERRIISRTASRSARRIGKLIGGRRSPRKCLKLRKLGKQFDRKINEINAWYWLYMETGAELETVNKMRRKEVSDLVKFYEEKGLKIDSILIRYKEET